MPSIPTPQPYTVPPLEGLLLHLRDSAQTERDKGTGPLELFLRVITVSLETMKIVKALPKLELP